MQIARQVCCVLAGKEAKNIHVKDFKLEFEDPKAPKEKISLEVEAAYSRAKWLGVLGVTLTPEQREQLKQQRQQAQEKADG